MFIRLCIGVLIVALILYYLLMMLNLFKVIKLTDSEEEMSWVPFYYLFKGKKKTKETQPQSKNVESEKKGRTDKKASGKTK